MRERRYSGKSTAFPCAGGFATDESKRSNRSGSRDAPDRYVVDLTLTVLDDAELAFRFVYDAYLCYSFIGSANISTYRINLSTGPPATSMRNDVAPPRSSFAFAFVVRVRRSR